MNRGVWTGLRAGLLAFGVATVAGSSIVPAAAAAAPPSPPACPGNPCVVTFHHAPVLVHKGTTIKVVADPGVCPMVQSSDTTVLQALAPDTTGCRFMSAGVGSADLFDYVYPPCPPPLPGQPPLACPPIENVIVHVVVAGPVVAPPSHHHRRGHHHRGH